MTGARRVGAGVDVVEPDAVQAEGRNGVHTRWILHHVVDAGRSWRREPDRRLQRLLVLVGLWQDPDLTGVRSDHDVDAPEQPRRRNHLQPRRIQDADVVARDRHTAERDVDLFADRETLARDHDLVAAVDRAVARRRRDEMERAREIHGAEQRVRPTGGRAHIHASQAGHVGSNLQREQRFARRAGGLRGDRRRFSSDQEAGGTSARILHADHDRPTGGSDDRRLDAENLRVDAFVGAGRKIDAVLEQAARAPAAGLG